MKRGIKRNSFAEGALLSYIAIVLTKVLGALYSIPFYSLIGDKGGFIYSCAYNIYALFLEISTSGIPVALSILIGEYTAMNKIKTRDKAYRLSLRVVTFISVFAFLFMVFFSKSIAGFFIGKMTYGATINDVSVAVRIVALSILVVPFLAVERGYMQGNKFIAISSNSQLVEQLIRILVVLGGAYLTINIMKLDVLAGVGIALSGAAVGGLAALIYLLRRKRANRFLFDVIDEDGVEEEVESSGVIAKKLVHYCTIVIIISITVAVYNIVDMKLLIVGLLNLGFSDIDTQTASSVTSMWVPKINNIISALALGMVSSIAPHIANDYTRGDMDAIEGKINQAIEIMMLIAVPLAIGVAIFSDEVYCLFFGTSAFGPNVLRLAVFFTVLASLVSVFSMSLQSMTKGNFVCFAMVLGMGLNTALDLPFIYLLHRLRLHAYVGATVSSIVAQTITFALLAVYMSRQTNVSYMHSLSTLTRLIIPFIALTAISFGMRLIWPPTTNRGLFMLFQLICYGVIGGGAYFAICSKAGIFEQVFGLGFIDSMKRILRRNN